MMISFLFGLLGGIVGCLVTLFLVILIADGTFDDHTFDHFEM